MKAVLKQIRISPKKANLIAALIRKKPAQDALDILKFTRKKAAPILYKLLASAVANAENNFKQKKDSLYVKEVLVTEGPTYKRAVPISRGRRHPILKRTSHISITVEAGATQKTKTSTPAPKAAVPEPKKEEPKKEESKKSTTKSK